jgi:hypothetical protein
MELYLRTIVSLIDEELALYSIIQLENQRVVTKHMKSILPAPQTGRYNRDWYEVVV